MLGQHVNISQTLYDLQERYRFSQTKLASWKLAVKQQKARESVIQKYSLNIMRYDQKEGGIYLSP
jgi:hypothetical protein